MLLIIKKGFYKVVIFIINFMCKGVLALQKKMEKIVQRFTMYITQFPHYKHLKSAQYPCYS